MSDAKLRNIIKDTDKMLISLVGEMDKLNHMLKNKMSENDDLREQNDQLEGKMNQF